MVPVQAEFATGERMRNMKSSSLNPLMIWETLQKQVIKF